MSTPPKSVWQAYPALKTFAADAYSRGQSAQLIANQIAAMLRDAGWAGKPPSRAAVQGRLKRDGIYAVTCRPCLARTPLRPVALERVRVKHEPHPGDAATHGAIIQRLEREAAKRWQEAADDPSTAPIMLSALVESSCRYPIGDAHPIAFCGRAKERGLPYCGEHAAACYQPPQPERRPHSKARVQAEAKARQDFADA